MVNTAANKPATLHLLVDGYRDVIWCLTLSHTTDGTKHLPANKHNRSVGLLFGHKRSRWSFTGLFTTTRNFLVLCLIWQLLIFCSIKLFNNCHTVKICVISIILGHLPSNLNTLHTFTHCINVYPGASTTEKHLKCYCIMQIVSLVLK